MHSFENRGQTTVSSNPLPVKTVVCPPFLQSIFFEGGMECILWHLKRMCAQ